MTAGPDGSFTASGPDAAKLVEEARRAALGQTAPDADLSRAIAEITERYRGHAPDEAVPALKLALAEHGREVPDEWLTDMAKTISEGGTTNLSFGGGSPTAP